MSHSISAAQIDRAALLIRAGKLVAFPTETVYGLGANALDPVAVSKIFELKGRPWTSPLIVHVSSIAMARELVIDWPAKAEELARRYWPGPLTIVLPKRPAISDNVTAGLPTVGVRVPSHPVALKLIEQAGVPIAAPSANRFMGLSPTTAEHVRAEFGDAVEILDGGPTDVGIESTVVSLVGGKLTLLRPGMISLVEIEIDHGHFPAVAQPVLPEAGGAHPAPGMGARHYSPRTPLVLVDGPAGLPDRRGAYAWRTIAGITARSVRMPEEPLRYAARLYSVLHELDQENWPWIAVETPPDTSGWAAIRDRLSRASSR